MNHKIKNFLDERLKSNHFIQHMGLVLHGGVTATLCDVTTGIAAYTTVQESKNVVTADLKVSYLNPSTSKKVKAVGKVRKAGNFLIYCECDVFDIRENEGEVLIATATAIMASVDIPTKK